MKKMVLSPCYMGIAWLESTAMEVTPRLEHSAEYLMFSYELLRLYIDLEQCEDAELQLKIAEDIELLERAISALQ